jgi:hypothetical protein
MGLKHLERFRTLHERGMSDIYLPLIIYNLQLFA